jgi:mRNA-degrading endonuclease YafQ of YafQ-DinJ toxin-antitoxin module
MDILIEITKSFEKDLKKLSQKDQEKIKEKINFLVDTFQETGNVRQLYRLHKIQMPPNLSSSLFVYKIDLHLRTILTFENDPLFNQTVLTLFRVVRHGDLEKTFKSVADSLYQNLFNSKDEANGRD